LGEYAEIFWGTAVDDSLGDEMRVTVIATGIGTEHGTAQESHLDHTLRGKIRDITPADLEREAIDFEEPTFIRRQKAVGESNGAYYRGHKGLIVDMDDLDSPTFLRKKAD